MKRHCSQEDDFIGDGKPGGERCGLMFDDVERSVICPHDFVQPVFANGLDCLIQVLQVKNIYEEYWNEKGINAP